MTDEILPKLGAAAARLNNSFDAISKRVQEIETHLASECSLGVTATVYSSDLEFGLRYGRWGNGWRFIVGTKLDSDGDFAESKAWSDCSRGLKLEVVPLLAPLLKQLAQLAETQARAAEEALASIPEVDSIPF